MSLSPVQTFFSLFPLSHALTLSFWTLSIYHIRSRARATVDYNKESDLIAWEAMLDGDDGKGSSSEEGRLSSTSGASSELGSPSPSADETEGATLLLPLMRRLAGSQGGEEPITLRPLRTRSDQPRAPTAEIADQVRYPYLARVPGGEIPQPLPQTRESTAVVDDVVREHFSHRLPGTMVAPPFLPRGPWYHKGRPWYPGYYK